MERKGKPIRQRHIVLSSALAYRCIPVSHFLANGVIDDLPCPLTYTLDLPLPTSALLVVAPVNHRCLYPRPERPGRSPQPYPPIAAPSEPRWFHFSSMWKKREQHPSPSLIVFFYRQGGERDVCMAVTIIMTKNGCECRPIVQHDKFYAFCSTDSSPVLVVERLSVHTHLYWILSLSAHGTAPGSRSAGTKHLGLQIHSTMYMCLLRTTFCLYVAHIIAVCHLSVKAESGRYVDNMMDAPMANAHVSGSLAFTKLRSTL